MTLQAVLLFWAIGLAQSPTAPAVRPSVCVQGAASVSDASVAELCLGEQQLIASDAMPTQSPQRLRQLEEAAGHYQRAARIASKAETRRQALEALTQLYDTPRLNQPRQMESVLRDLISLQPNELAPVFRLAKLQEDEGLIDAAEDVLLSARRQLPDAVEAYQMLARFYARRATALHKQTESQKPADPPGAPGERDANGVYRIGGSIESPARLDVARYPPEAAAAGIQGTVLAEIVINESGNVTDAKVVRSIPMPDEAALQAVRNWHFAPTLVNGQGVPVRMVVTVNFTTR
jgi:TonB family protein